MKKVVLLTLAAIMLTGGLALANPVFLDGQAVVRQRSDTNGETGDKDGYKFTLTLNALDKLDRHFDLYARLGAQYVSKPGFDNDFFNNSRHVEAALDQYGFIYKNGGSAYKIGRQAVTLGETALLYNTATFIGRNQFADGLTVATKLGAVDLKIVAVQENNASEDDNRLYAAQASYRPPKGWGVGAVVARYDQGDDAAKAAGRHWGINVGYALGKARLVGEMTQSNAAASNDAHVVCLTYAFDRKNTAYVYTHKTEQYGDIGGKTDWDNGQRGYYYGFDHKINRSATFSLLYKDNEVIATNEKRTSLRTTISYAF